MAGRQQRQPEERGATLVEFAFVLPLFILLLFAIIDFGWLFTQFLDVKQGAREGARLAIVNDCDETLGADACRDEIIQKICERTQDIDSKEAIQLVREQPPNSDALARVTVTYPAESITGMMAVFINGKTLESTVTMRTEKLPTWSNTTAPTLCPP